MKHFYFSLLLLLTIPVLSTAQKQLHIPNEWQSGTFDYSMERSAESENFVIFWGPLAGLDPNQAAADISFDPENILLTAEDLYSFYIDSLHFLPDTAGLLSEWKMILVMLHTWEGLEGWAFGGQYDGVTGAMWMHPHAASDGPTLAHEFTHALQNYTWMMYPGHGFINNDYVGFIWEAHAEFMALQYYPEAVALNFDLSRWMNTSQQHWSSTRHHYQAWVFLEFIKETDGLEIINRMWRESLIGEHPLQTLMRISERDQQELNDLFGQYAMRNVQWDYEIGGYLRQHVANMPEKFKLNITLIPEAMEEESGFYQIHDHRSPQDYGYNHIRLFLNTPDSCEESLVHIRFRGYDEAAEDAGWRWGLVAINADGEPRYSELKTDNGEMVFPLEEDEQGLYLVVSGAPTTHHNYIWEAGFPKIYRYPYSFRVEGAVPEGYQPGYTRVPEGVSGSNHPNGGGFVASTASVAPTAWVDSTAAVLGQAVVQHMARIEDHAVVKDNALIQNDARVSGYAMVDENGRVYEQGKVGGHARIGEGSTIHGDAMVNGHPALFYTSVNGAATVTDNTFCWGAQLGGSVYLGGDAEFFIPCNAGIYLQFQGAYGRECDGLDSHPSNVPVNSPYTNFGLQDLPLEETFDCNEPYTPCAPPASTYTTDVTLSSAVLHWTPVPGAQGYHIQGKPVSASSWININVGGAVTQYSTGNILQLGLTYEWRIRTICIGGTSAWSTLTQFSILCSAPTVLYTSNITATSATLNWSAVEDADGYQIRGRQMGTGSWTTINVGATTQVNTGPILIPGANYEWKIRTNCGEGYSAFSALERFRAVNTGESNLAFKGESESHMSVFPNPNKGQFVLQFSSDVEVCELTMTDLVGKEVYRHKFTDKGSFNQQTIQLNGLPAGIYLLNAHTNNWSQTVKLVFEP